MLNKDYKLELIRSNMGGISPCHMLIKAEMGYDYYILFVYDTPIFKVVYDRRSGSCIVSEFEFFNYMRLFVPQHFNKAWNKEHKTLSNTTKAYITKAIEQYPIVKRAFDYESKVIAETYTRSTPKECLEFEINALTGYQFDIDTGIYKEYTL